MDQPTDSKPSMQKNTLMAVLAYVGPLVVVSYLVAKDDPFVKYHIKQGLVLFVIEIILWVIMDLFLWQIYMIWPLIDLIDLALLVLAVMGIVNASQGKEVPLPIVGSWSNSFPI